MNVRWLVFSAAAALCLSSGTASFAGSSSWLDKKPVPTWNKAGAALPHAGKGDPENAAHCTSGVRKAASPEDRLVAAAGWKLVGARQSFETTSVVEAAAGFDGMCRWAGYQAFVFAGGVFAGTLAPKAMDSRSDGALDEVHLTSAKQFTAQFTRYADSDPLCCPSRTSYVTYSLLHGSRGSVVTVSDVATAAAGH
jgi:hypothetical protein